MVGLKRQDHTSVVIETALILAIAKGWDFATPAMISRHCGVSQSWISRRFAGGAEGIHAAVLSSDIQRMVDELSEIHPCTKGKERVKAVISALSGNRGSAGLIAIWGLAYRSMLVMRTPLHWAAIAALEPVAGVYASDLMGAWTGIIMRHVINHQGFSVPRMERAMHKAAVGFMV